MELFMRVAFSCGLIAIIIFTTQRAKRKRHSDQSDMELFALYSHCIVEPLGKGSQAVSAGLVSLARSDSWDRKRTVIDGFYSVRLAECACH